MLTLVGCYGERQAKGTCRRHKWRNIETRPCQTRPTPKTRYARYVVYGSSIFLPFNQLLIALQPRSPSGSSNFTKTADAPPPCGCALLQWLRDQLAEGRYATTGGDYLEIIFTHREAFHAFPDGHRTCAIGFSDIAADLERREMRPDRESDPEAAAAFRHEAWVIASSGVWSQPTI